MTDRKADILKQLERGELTAEQALAMLNQVPPTQQGAPPPEPTHQHHKQHQSGHDANWVDGLVNWVGNIVHDVTDEVGDWDFSISDFLESGHKRHEVFTSSPVSQGIASLALPGKNARVEVQGYDGSTVTVECKILARYPDAEIYLHEENGHIQLMYEPKQMRSVAIYCQVPNTQIKELQITNKNSKIVVNHVSAGEMRLRTTNSAIKISNVKANAAMLQTTNSGIKAEYIDINHLKLATTNAGLKFKENLLAVDNHWNGERTIEATTTNAGIGFYIPADASLQIDASTRNGRVVLDRDDMYFAESSKTHLQGKSSDYDFSGKKLNLELKTTNASVKVRNSQT